MSKIEQFPSPMREPGREPEPRIVWFSLSRRGGLRFLRIGRLRVQWSWVRR